MDRTNIRIVNNTCIDLSPWYANIRDAVVNDTALPPDLDDIVTLEVLAGYNPDGSNRGIIREA